VGSAVKTGNQPRSINLFAILFIFQALISSVHNVLSPQSLRAQLAADFQPDEWLTAVFALDLAVRLGIALFLVWFVWARASKVAKWVCVVFALGPLMQVQDVWTGLQSGNINSIAWVARQTVALIAVSCFFLPASRYWFASRGRSVKGDAEVFR